MNDKQKKALIQELSALRHFEPSYSKENREWFVERLLRGYEEKGLGDSQIERNVRDVVSRSKVIAEAKRDFRLKLKFHETHPGSDRWARPKRVQILYGLIAQDPGLSEQANEKLLDFIAARRYRAVQRMINFVNGGELFHYPLDNDCPGKPLIRVNAAAEQYWEPVPNRVAIDFKLRPQPPAMEIRPEEAILGLWKSQEDPCDESTFECGTAMSSVLMDSLLEANDPPRLLKSVASRSDMHLSICRPHFGRGEHFLWDEDIKRLFSKEGGRPEDLLVGDHVYIWNHPIYPELDPNGVWRGEHALLADATNRNLRNGMRFSGHGFAEDTIATINGSFLKTVNTFLDRAYRLGSIFLKYLESGKTSIPPSKVKTPGHVVQGRWMIGGSFQTIDIDLYFFDVDYEFTNYHESTKISAHGFIVSHMRSNIPVSTLDGTARPTFGLHNGIDLAIEERENPMGGTPFFQRISAPTAGESEFDPVLWKIPYTDLETRGLKMYPIFRRDSGRLTWRRMAPGDLPIEPLAKAKHTIGPNEPLPEKIHSPEEPFITRPTVILYSTPYEDFLKAGGAIP